MKTNKHLHGMIAATLLCGATVFSACTVDNPEEPETIVDLATLTEDYIAQDGDKLTGTLATELMISIADGASITLENVNINPTGTVFKEHEFAGITCLGDATITLRGTNVIRGFDNFYPALYVPGDHTLTIDGDGSLDAKASGTIDTMAAAIGSMRVGEKSGNLVFLGGVITAEGGYDSAAIGTSYDSECGDITIGGTAEITAIGFRGMPAIGSSSGHKYTHCGDITIGGNAKVKAVSSYSGAAIGAGPIGTCGNITIEEKAEVNAENTDYGAAIGTSSGYAICKAITISGGTVIASVYEWCPAIGTGAGDKAKCESITITGGTIVATGGADAPAIGSGAENTNDFPIVITAGITSITATRGNDLADYIGGGADGTHGVVTIDGVKNATPESTFPYINHKVEGDTWILVPKFN